MATGQSLTARYRERLTSLVRWAALATLLTLVCLPRFNLRDWGAVQLFTKEARNTPYGLPLDVAGYIRLTDYFRGATPADSLLSPYCYRPLIPLVAAILPWDAQTAINLIDLLSLLLTAVVMDRMMRDLRFSIRVRNAGAGLFIVSFPTFYYGTIGFVDPPSIFLIALGARLALKHRYIAVGALTIIAVLVKETNAVIALLPILSAWASQTLSARVWMLSLGYLVLAGGISFALRLLPSFPNPSFFWGPQWSYVVQNFTRPRALLSLILTMAVPTTLAVASIVAGRARQSVDGPAFRFLLAGWCLCGSLYLYSLASAYADGRVIWASYPFVIPLAVSWFEPSIARTRTTALSLPATPERQNPF